MMQSHVYRYTSHQMATKKTEPPTQDYPPMTVPKRELANQIFLIIKNQEEREDAPQSIVFINLAFLQN